MKTFKNKFETWIFNETQRFFIYKTTIKADAEQYFEFRYYLQNAVNGQSGLEVIKCKFIEDLIIYPHLPMFYKEPWSMISEKEAQSLKKKLIKLLFKIKR